MSWNEGELYIYHIAVYAILYEKIRHTMFFSVGYLITREEVRFCTGYVDCPSSSDTSVFSIYCHHVVCLHQLNHICYSPVLFLRKRKLPPPEHRLSA